MSKVVIPTDYGGWSEVEVDSNGNYKYQEKDDVTLILKNNAEARAKGPEYKGKGTQTSAQKIGSISPLMMTELIKQGIFWDDKKLMAWFDDLDNYLWRTVDKSRV